MREIEPQQTRVRLRRVAHEIVVIAPNNGDEKIAHRVAQPCGPKRQECLERGNLRWTQSKTSTVIRTANTPSENALNRSGVALWSTILPFRVHCEIGVSKNRPGHKSRTSNAFVTLQFKVLAWLPVMRH